jgi:hypothetical protein
MRRQAEYSLELFQPPDARFSERAFDLVWRFTFSAPGFCYLDTGPGIDSHTLRAWMVDLKRHLNDLCWRHTGKNLLYRSLARFDQQETTKFHIDGAPTESLLMLGYESSKVRSRLFLADYTRAAFDLAITPEQFLHDFNPMYKKGEELLSRYVTELPRLEEGHSMILLINNSRLPFVEDAKHPLGVMHKAEILNPSASERRIVNSTMLCTEGEELSEELQQEFVSTDKISQKAY